MDEVAGFHVYSVEMTAAGQVAEQAQAQALMAAAAGPDGPRDLLVLVHGWNNDMAEARDLYRRLLSELASLLPPEEQAKTVVAGILWPSKTFSEDDLVPGRRRGGAAGAGTGPEDAVTDARLAARLREVAGDFDRANEADLTEAEGLIARLESDPEARDRFVELLRKMLPPLPEDSEDGSDLFNRRKGHTILKDLQAPLRVATPERKGGGLGRGARNGDDNRNNDADRGSAAGLGDLLRGMRGAAWQVLNLATYYQMKERAGQVGRGLNGLLADLRNIRPDLRIHLVGHSFGARAATAAVDGPRPFEPWSLVLLQGAFSHHGFATDFDGSRDGAFANVVAEGKVKGPIAITHSRWDRAVGKAYALASRLVKDNAKAVGDAGDPFGGIGRNGALKLPADKVKTDRLRPADEAFALELGRVTNLQADLPVGEAKGLILSHGDVTNPATAALVRAALN